MQRPRLVWAIGVLAFLGLAAGAEAAEPIGLLLAQSASLVRGPGMYLNLFKFVPVLLIYLMWAWTTNWVDSDTKDLNNVRFEMWNSVVFFSGVLGFALLWLIPIYILGIILLVLAYFGPLFTYIYIRNQTVPDEQMVLTPYHLGEVANALLRKMGMKGIFNRGDDGSTGAGPPIVFVGKGMGAEKEDPSRVEKAEQSVQYIAAKELVYDAILGARPTFTSNRRPSSSRSGTASTASCTRRSRSTGPRATR